ADQPTTHTYDCVGNDGSTLGASATIKFVTGTDADGHSILVLKSVKSVMNGCNVEFAELSFANKKLDISRYVWIGRGGNRALGPAVLQKLGMADLQFNSWGMPVRARARGPVACGARGEMGFVSSDGHVTACPQPPA